MPVSEKDVIIIGAGASGLICAAECGKRGRSVLVLDHGDRACAKVLVSGGGRCNFTNLNVSAENYLSANPHFCRSALARFTPQDFLSLLKKHRIPWYEKEEGQLFCKGTARDIAEMLLKECGEAGVEIRFKCRGRTIDREEGFIVTTEQDTIRAESLVIATGGLSYPQLGATGFGHDIARQFGLKLVAPRPALVPLTFSGQDRKFFQGLAGISLPAAIACLNRKFRGSVLFTHRGLSGPAMLQASSYWKEGTTLSIDLFPGIDLGALLSAQRGSRIELRNLLSGHLPKRLAEAWCEHFSPSKPMNQFSDKDLRSLEESLHAWEIKPAGTEGYKTAEVTAGGVDTEGISSKTMEARTVPGLYFIGEVLDVTGHLGGYNLHWAWASGFAAGQYA